MWHEAALVFLINFLILHLPSLSNVDKVVLEIALYFIIAINANRWLEDDLQKKRGYKFSGMVGAASPLDAKLRFFEKSAA